VGSLEQQVDPGLLGVGERVPQLGAARSVTGDPGAQRLLRVPAQLEIGDAADGFELLRRLRARGDPTPVLVLTAREAVDERVHGLALGADDYLTKPFSLSELEARVRARLRRAKPPLAARIVVGSRVVDGAAR